jgi:hypothetical protein
MIKFLYKDPIHLPEDTPTDHDLSKTLVEDFEDWLSQHQRHKLRPFTKHDPTDLDLYKNQKVQYVKLNTMHDLTTPEYAGKIILLLVYGNPNQCGVACSQVIFIFLTKKGAGLAGRDGNKSSISRHLIPAHKHVPERD